MSHPHTTPRESAIGLGPDQTGFAPASLREMAAADGIELSPEATARFDTYRDLLLEWNTRTNLTAITDPAEVDRRLFLDALLMLPGLDAALVESGDPPYRLVDVGSGAGFPGIPIKIMRPDLDVTLVEATGKKVAFLHACIAALGLRRITAIHARAEDLGHDASFREHFDLVTARAVASLPALLELGAPLLRLGGRGLFPKGTGIEEEIAAARVAGPIVGARVASVRALPGGQTTLIVVEKTGRTPIRYPRRAGIPSREPLGRTFRAATEPAARTPSGVPNASSPASPGSPANGTTAARRGP